jgi:hypothetical protein
MLATTILKCILLAKTHVLVLEQPINEYAMATIEKTFNDVFFQGTVVEGKMNSVLIRYPKLGAESMSYSPSGYDLKALSIKLDVANEHAALDCEIIDLVTK